MEANKETHQVFIQPVSAEKDIAALCGLARSIWREHYTKIIGSAQVEYMLDKFQSEAAVSDQLATGYSYFGIIRHGILAGYFSWQPRGEHLFLSKIYVTKEQRGTGLGTHALQFIYESAAALGLQHIQLTVNKHNKETIAYYKSRGFSIIEPVVFDIGAGFIMDDYLMRKTIIK